ncbi:MAG: hypothetical protein F6J93_19525 [Oscillatoria sp. SIO1A7]|nr:hypothetical protein [Oscillatoria sp. SIO1A7]
MIALRSRVTVSPAILQLKQALTTVARNPIDGRIANMKLSDSISQDIGKKLAYKKIHEYH